MFLLIEYVINLLDEVIRINQNVPNARNRLSLQFIFHTF